MLQEYKIISSPHLGALHHHHIPIIVVWSPPPPYSTIDHREHRSHNGELAEAAVPHFVPEVPPSYHVHLRHDPQGPGIHGDRPVHGGPRDHHALVSLAERHAETADKTAATRETALNKKEGGLLEWEKDLVKMALAVTARESELSPTVGAQGGKPPKSAPGG